MLLDLRGHGHLWGPGTTESQCGGSWSHEEAWSVPETGPCLVPPGREGTEIAWLLPSSCPPDFCSCLLLAKPSWKPADLGAGDRQPVVSPPPLRAEQGRVGGTGQRANRPRMCMALVLSVSCPSLVFMSHAVLRPW